MRTVTEIEQEFTFVCARIGDLELKRTAMNAQVDTALAPLHEQARLLREERAQLQLVQDELSKAALTPPANP
jgi:hypothetical protein